MEYTLKFVKRYPFAILLAVQLFSVLFYGFMTSSKTSVFMFNCLGLIVPILAVWVVYRSPITSWVGFVLVTASLSTTLIALLFGYIHLFIWAHAFESLLYFYASVGMLQVMYADDIVTRDELFAVGATFTLLVWGFALAYSVCQQIYPQSLLAAVNSNSPRSWAELLFMSFSIQSGTGVGDIIPISSPARAIASLQIFSSVMYLTIAVSRLVGLTITQK